MRILFLDIDGVLNSDLWYQSEPQSQIEGPLKHFDPRCVSILNRLLKKIHAKVVLSSTWRLKYSLSEMQRILLAAGLQLDLIGFTPDLKAHNDAALRGNEILKWCMDHEDVIGCRWKDFQDFVILDDNTDFLLWQADHFFKTDRYCGLTATVKGKVERWVTRVGK